MFKISFCSLNFTKLKCYPNCNVIKKNKIVAIWLQFKNIQTVLFLDVRKCLPVWNFRVTIINQLTILYVYDNCTFYIWDYMSLWQSALYNNHEISYVFYISFRRMTNWHVLRYSLHLVNGKMYPFNKLLTISKPYLYLFFIDSYHRKIACRQHRCVIQSRLCRLYYLNWFGPY